MKKQFNKKLSLKKATITVLRDNNSNAVKGGIVRTTEDYNSCPSCVNKISICNCAETENCVTRACPPYSNILINTVCSQ